MSKDAIKVDSACCNLVSTQYNGNYFFGRTWTVLFTCLYQRMVLLCFLNPWKKMQSSAWYSLSQPWRIVLEHDMVGRGKHRRIVYQLIAVCTENEDWRKLLFAKMHLVDRHTQMMIFFSRPIFLCMGGHSFS